MRGYFMSALRFSSVLLLSLGPVLCHGFQGGVCTPAGTWNWVGGLRVIIHADGSLEGFVGSNRSYTGSWVATKANGYRLTWRENGSVDTLRLSSDGKYLDGSNAAGTNIHVTCQGGPQPEPEGKIGLNGCWAAPGAPGSCGVHFYQEGEELFFMAAWKNPPGSWAEGAVVQKGHGWVRGRDVFIGEVTWPSMIGPGKPHKAAEYHFTLSPDGNQMTGYWTVEGERGGNLTWVRDQ
jgi:hypothetical protein